MIASASSPMQFHRDRLWPPACETGFGEPVGRGLESPTPYWQHDSSRSRPSEAACPPLDFDDTAMLSAGTLWRDEQELRTLQVVDGAAFDETAGFLGVSLTEALDEPSDPAFLSPPDEAAVGATSFFAASL